MSAPTPVFPPPDFGIRAPSSYDLEKTLVAFIKKITDPRRMDNPTLNLAQATAPSIAPPDPDPDTYVSYDPKQSAETLYLKVAPQVVRGRVPRTVTGEIALDRLPDVPAIIVQAVEAKVNMTDSHTVKEVTVRILINAYDEDPASGGYQDCINMAELLEIALTNFGIQAIDQAYPILFPIEWRINENDTFPHYIAEMTTHWQLPAGRPMPDLDPWLLAPSEWLDVRASIDPHYPQR